MIYVVTGFMRSGTSMLMHAVHAGGIPISYNPTRDEFSASYSDGHYKMNPFRLYEFTIREMQAPRWPVMYEETAVKCVVPFLGYLAVHDYCVAFLERDAEEIRQSCEAAFEAHYTTEYIEASIREAHAALRNRRDVREVVTVSYLELLTNPLKELSKLNWPFDLSLGAATIDLGRYRFRRELLVRNA